MYLVETLTFLLCIKMNADNGPDYSWEKELNISLEELNRQNVKYGFKRV